MSSSSLLENDQGENYIQDPSISSTATCIKPRVVYIRPEFAGLYNSPLPNAHQVTKTAGLHEKKHIKLPWDLEDAKQLGLVLDRYKDKYFYQVLIGVFLVYIFLQTFAIPGSLFLSILSGFLFPFYLALLLVCCCSAIGASLCFFLSHLLGKRLVKRFFPERAAQWSITVEKHKNNLLNYMIFLRVTPFLPNWFINLTAPVIGVPLVPFALGTFIGVAPPSFVAIQAGQTLHTLTSTREAWSWTSVTILSAFALISLVPVLLKQRLREKFE
ncbi:unnamed protein product [Leptidea sinapis]|uniref:VTT domain-containing protein n=1 Tax=Leptidea sinapis TaxID=189913 RepID=A0A5E4Q2G4_9NEOP|nr:unnamed protein product [Leptidea sinapis]